MKKKLITLSVITLLLTACGNSDFADNKIPEESLKPTVAVVDSPKKTETIPVNEQVVQQQQQQQQPTPATDAKGLNPEHGKPGHRCDIPVGAPLSSPINKQNPTTTQQTSTTKTQPGMNPPHGEPGHRCDIAVGAPLNSAPVTQAAQQSNTTKVVTPPGMNPPHGEPGHRCDIAVGSPLNSAPETKPAEKTVKADTSVKK